MGEGLNENQVIDLQARLSWLTGELRGDHAGETGAVWIYRGILALRRKPSAIRDFSMRHRQCEEKHLALMETLLGERHRSRLLPLWRVAGFLTGAIPALFGDRWVYVMINAVENFVEEHYVRQITQLHDYGMYRHAALLEGCMRDEIMHGIEAGQHIGERSRLDNLVHRLVGCGSEFAVNMAKKV